MKIVLEEGAFLPTRAHDTDAGLDLYTREAFVVPAHGRACVDIGVHMEIPPYYVGFIKSKSGLYRNHGITVDGTVDAGYTGSFNIILCNHSDEDCYFIRGDKIAQIVLLPIVTPQLTVVDSLDETPRGDNGFGSTGSNITDTI